MDPHAAYALFVVTLGAVLVPFVARRAGLPVAVAEIGYGLLVGASGVGLVGPDDRELNLIAKLGFALFLLLAGMELDVATIVRGGVRPLVLPVVAAGSALAVGLLCARALHVPQWVGLAAGVIAVPLAMAVLREAELVATPFGKRVLLFAGVGELLSISMIAMFDVGAGTRGEGRVYLVLGVLRALLPLAATLTVGVLLRTLLWWFPTPFVRFVTAEDRQELGVRAGFALMFAGIVVTALGGIEPLLGAFFAGLLVSYVVRDRQVIEHKLAGVAYGFFVPVFFVDVGARIDVAPAALVANAALIAGVLLVVLASRLPAFLLMSASGTPLAEASAASLLLAAPLTLQIAVADLGGRNGIFPADVEGAIVIAAVLGGVVFPALARRLLPAPETSRPSAAALPR